MAAAEKVIFLAPDGTKRKFPLVENGKVRVGDVLLAFDACLVEFEDEDATLSVLTPDASGLSTDTFQGGASINVHFRPARSPSGYGIPPTTDARWLQNATFQTDNGTPPTIDFDKWLKNATFPEDPTIEEVEFFLKSAPISKRTAWFICRFLVTIPTDGTSVRVVQSMDGPYFERPDYLEFFMEWGKNAAKVLVLAGRRRSGKTIGLPLELLKARKIVLKKTDKVMFYFPGDEEHEQIHFSTIIKLLALMKIPALFDEFTSMSTKICRSYKIFLENWASFIDPLSAVLFGSNESMIWTEGTSSIAGCCSIGGFMRRLPSPPLALMLSMLREREQHLKGSELGMMFLRKLTLHGCDLSSHNRNGLTNESSLQVLKDLGLQQITFTSGASLKALEKLVFNKGHAKGIDFSTLIELQSQEYITLRPNTTEYYDFSDPRMMAFYGCTINESLEWVEGKVLELLLQTKKYLLQELLSLLKINEEVEKVIDNLWHGQITSSAEIDLLFFCERGSIFHFSQASPVKATVGKVIPGSH